jgi:general secretion pathway protein B
MSLILEALKKSEQQRRLGEAPTLGSPVVATRRRRSLIPVLAALIVVAAAAGWWLTRSARRDATPPIATTPSAPMTALPAPARKPLTKAGRRTRNRRRPTQSRHPLRRRTSRPRAPSSKKRLA